MAVISGTNVPELRTPSTTINTISNLRGAKAAGPTAKILSTLYLGIRDYDHSNDITNFKLDKPYAAGDLRTTLRNR